jgi:hypothetical protein
LRGIPSASAAAIISPHAKRHFIDHNQYDTIAILRLIERRWNLLPLSSQDASAGGLRYAFNF